MLLFFFFFFKQKTAYEMRISDWSSDVCSSDLTAGDIASWQVGPFASVIDPDTGNRVGLPVGSNGFPGFSPIQAGEFARSNWAAYTSLEGNLTDALQFGLAGRYENYSDFGSKFTWKINGRYRSEEHTSELQSLMRISYAV